jgi:RNA ligase (TIGR02306 family)
MTDLATLPADLAPEVENIEQNLTKFKSLATIQRIVALDPIDNADSLECAQILGWHVVVKKGEFKAGDLVVYVVVGSILPDRAEFEFMKARDFRVKTIKLRGQISQGIAFPLSILPESFTAGNASISNDKWLTWEGEDVTEVLNVRKYMPPETGQCKIRSHVRKGRVENWPSFLQKTDEERIQNCYGVIQNYLGKEFYTSEKLDGQSCTMYFKDNEFGVCSRNFDLEPDPGEPFWSTAIEIDAEAKLRRAFTENYSTEYAVQGERVGPGVQGNKLKLDKVRFFAFNVFNITAGKYLDYTAFKSFCSLFGFDTVPLDPPFVLNHTVDELVGMSTIKSSLNRDVWIEGKVFRPTVESFERKLGRVSFKVINPEFSLRFEE